MGLGHAQDEGLSVAQIMRAMVTPATNGIWGAYEIQTDAQWQELENAALTVVAAGSLLAVTGEHASNPDWQEYTQQMIAAARAARPPRHRHLWHDGQFVRSRR